MILTPARMVRLQVDRWNSDRWPVRLAKLAVAACVVFGSVQIAEGVYIKAKAQVAQVLLERAWRRALAGEIAPKPWPWADTWPVGRITVPRLGKSAIILSGASGEAMAFGPGLSASGPALAKQGTAIIGGHRDTHFAFLKDLIVGEEVEIESRSGIEHYEIERTEIVLARASGIEPFAPGHRVALVTCWPFDALVPGPLRYVVYARRINPGT